MCPFISLIMCPFTVDETLTEEKELSIVCKFLNIIISIRQNCLVLDRVT